jgi:hypothetical protein
VKALHGNRRLKRLELDSEIAAKDLVFFWLLQWRIIFLGVLSKGLSFEEYYAWV